MKTTIFSIALAMSCAVAPAAFASPTAGEPVSVEINVAQYNLVSEAGANAAYADIRNQVREACGVSHGRIGLKALITERSCVSTMTDKAVTAIAAPKLTRIHAPAKI